MSSSPTGWPRPMRPYVPVDPNCADASGETVMLPLPWITPDGDPPRWSGVRVDNAVAHHERLCQVCCEELAGRMVLAAVAHESGHTHGSGMHPRCAALAFKHCPHFETGGEDAHVGWVYEGSGVGYEVASADTDPFNDSKPVCADARPITRAEAKRLARTDPMGDRSDAGEVCPHQGVDAGCLHAAAA